MIQDNTITDRLLKQLGFTRNQTFQNQSVWHKFWKEDAGTTRIEIYNLQDDKDSWMCNIQRFRNNLICMVANMDEVKTCLKAAHISVSVVSIE